ncbi:hypothetical protein ACFQVC_40060 [Streptomyces monticola]|uniref:Uncharacterized protein n=1 Tax=Streptomyces monticola TaxID=2666263 RepID=A0ABW2JXY5_9ACTN
MHVLRHSELIAEAAAHRLAVEARTAAKTRNSRRFSRRSGGRAPEGQVSDPRRRTRFARAA